MTLLIANIGTSDIAVKIGDYFIPLGFNREEINLELPESGTPDRTVWDERIVRVRNLANQELGLKLTEKESPYHQFRRVSGAVLNAYQENPEAWHPRIRIGRIWGAISKALQQEPQIDAKLVVTDQPETEVKGYPSDTVHAYEIVKTWIQREKPELFAGDTPMLSIDRELIEFKAVDEDALLEYYYQLFSTIASDRLVYVSVKGGTPQMQQALKIQAIASNTKAQIFLSPRPKVKRILAGKPSDCELVSYWRYRKARTYQAVKQLLGDRWDFDGARVLLEEWDQTLQMLLKRKVKDVNRNRQTLKQEQEAVRQAIQGLNMGMALFNLDVETAKDQAKNIENPPDDLESFNSLENLYVQCKIFNELKQIGHFLHRTGSLYEATQQNLIRHFCQASWLEIDKSGQLTLQVKYIAQHEPDLWLSLRTYHWDCLQDGVKNFGWNPDKKFDPVKDFWDFSRLKTLKLNNRFIRRSLIQALMDYPGSNPSGDRLPLDPWYALDFWYEVRNGLVHSAEGYSEQRIAQVYQDRKAQHRMACPYDDILLCLEQMLGEVAKVIPASEKESLLRVADSYGVYGKLRDWVNAQLNG